MSNGQRRNRRGARPRPTPHKHGGAGPGRAATQLIPPVSAPTKASGESLNESVNENDNDNHSVNESVNDGVNEDAASDVTPELTPDAPPVSEALDDHANHTDHAAHHANQHNHHNHYVSPPMGAPDTPPPAARGRFDRFYAPGQGARAERGAERGERVERVAPPIASASPMPSSPPAPRRRERGERIERAAHINDALDEDDGAEYSGPRSDVRGSVAPLVDALHEVFARDRAIASQGGVARCGVCYLHFPVDELAYREGEGFYVCASCAHALGAARVPMVRRQQRQ